MQDKKDNTRIVRITTELVASMIISAAIVTGAWWRDKVESGENVYATAMTDTQAPGAYNPKTSPQGETFVTKPSEAQLPAMYYTANGSIVRSAMEMTLTTTALAAPSLSPSAEKQYLYIDAVQQTINNIRNGQQRNPSQDASPILTPQITDYSSILPTFVSPWAKNRPIAVAYQGSYQPSNHSSVSQSSASVLPNYAAHYQSSGAKSYVSSFASVASSAMTISDGPAASAGRRATNDNGTSGFFATPYNAPLSFGWDVVILMALLAIGYAVRRRRVVAETR